jgi:Polysaccharide lyase
MRFLFSAVFMFLFLGCGQVTPESDTDFISKNIDSLDLDWTPLKLQISGSDTDFYSHGTNLSLLSRTKADFSDDFQKGINAGYLKGSMVPYNRRAPKWRFIQIQNPLGVQVLTHYKTGNNILKTYWVTGGGLKYDDNTQKKIQIYGNWGPNARLEEVWTFQSAFLSNEFKYDNYGEILVQFHENPDKCEYDRRPPLAIEIKRDSLIVIWRNDERKCTPGGEEDPNEDIRNLGIFPKDQVLNWHIHIRWNPNGKGALTIIINNKIQLMEDNLFIGYEDDVSPYIGWGIYKFPKTSDHPSRTGYYDNFKQWIIR